MDMYCSKVRDVLLNNGFVFSEKHIPYGVCFKFLEELILMVYNTGFIVFQGKCNKNKSLKKELQSLLLI
jgi:hypothetical protein